MNDSVPEFTKIQKQFSDHIRNPDEPLDIVGIETRRLKIYQELFFNNILGFVSSAFPVLKEIIGEERWQQLVRDFFITHQCDSPLFLEISEEFLSYLEHADFDFLEKFTYQLAHWEWMELYADVAETNDVSEVITDLELTDVVTSNDCTWNVAYDFCVHKISSDNIPELTSEHRESTFLLVHRDHDLSVGFIEINSLSMLLFEQLKSNANHSLEMIFNNIAKQQNIDSSIIIKGGLEIIRQWGLLGLLKPLY
jgi:hypothetical protein